MLCDYLSQAASPSRLEQDKIGLKITIEGVLEISGLVDLTCIAT